MWKRTPELGRTTLEYKLRDYLDEKFLNMTENYYPYGDTTYMIVGASRKFWEELILPEFTKLATDNTFIIWGVGIRNWGVFFKLKRRERLSNGNNNSEQHGDSGAVGHREDLSEAS